MKGQPHQEKVYIVTQDLGPRIANLRTLGLRTFSANDRIFADFHHELKDLLIGILPGVHVVSYDMSTLTEKVWTEALRVQSALRDALVVSTCAEVASPRRGHIIEVNRIFDEHGVFVGLGPRPGNVPLQNQINSIAAASDGNPVVIVEDGAFTGDTIIGLIRLFRERRVNVSAVTVGLCFPGAKEAIRKEFKGEICVINQVEKPHEWMPDHDFIPFAPNCGRVYGRAFGSDNLPFYTHDGISYCLPYVLPFGDPVKWASIPAKEAPRFSAFCLEWALKIFRRLDEMNGRRLCMKDLLGATPRISVPMTKGSTQLPSTDVPVSDFLSETLHMF